MNQTNCTSDFDHSCGSVGSYKIGMVVFAVMLLIAIIYFVIRKIAQLSETARPSPQSTAMTSPDECA